MNTIKSIISTASLYIMFGVWSFIHMMEYKYFTRIEQYDSIVGNMEKCNKKYTELLLKIIHMENRIAELEDILYITDELSLETVAPKVVEEEVSPEVVEEVSPEVVEEEVSPEVVEEEEAPEVVEPLAPKVVEEEESVASLEVEEVVEEIIIKLELEEETTKVVVETVAVDNFDAGELVDLSTEEKETNSNKKGWVKTLLFL